MSELWGDEDWADGLVTDSTIETPDKTPAPRTPWARIRGWLARRPLEWRIGVIAVTVLLTPLAVLLAFTFASVAIGFVLQAALLPVSWPLIVLAVDGVIQRNQSRKYEFAWSVRAWLNELVVSVRRTRAQTLITGLAAGLLVGVGVPLFTPSTPVAVTLACGIGGLVGGALIAGLITRFGDRR